MSDPGRRPGAPGTGRRDRGTSAGTPSPAAFAGLGIQLVVSILVFVYAGRWLDGKLGTSPWLLVLGAFVGAFAGFYSMYRSLMAQSGQNRRGGSRRDEGGDGGEQ